MLDSNQPIVWKPLPGSQTLAMSCPAQIILFHGSRGPGKTDAQLMRFRRWVGQGFGRHWRGVIFDRQYKNLDDLVSKSMRWFPEFKDGAKFVSSKSDYKWVWKTGEELLFRAVTRATDYWGYHGQEFPFIGWNELTKYPTDELFEAMMSCNRSSYRPQDFPIINEDGSIYYTPEIPLEVFATCNPYGAGHNWVKKRFINAAPMGRIARKSVNVFNPQTKDREDVITTQAHIFGSYMENIYLSPKYIAELTSMTDKNKREAWLGGSWDIVAGGMFDDVWSSQYNVVTPFAIPTSWRIDRSFDWGSSKPFSVGWWAESDGSDIRMPDGTIRSTVRGDLFRIAEWYGCTGKPNQGLNMLASKIAEGIIHREVAWGIHGKVQDGPADGSIFDVVNGNSIAVDMSNPVRLANGTMVRGVFWGRADKSPGSRIAGWQKCRKYIFSSKPGKNGPREHPGLFVFDVCSHFLDLFITLPRDELNTDDVDTEAEDHIGDEVRYRVSNSGVGAVAGRTKGT